MSLFLFDVSCVCAFGLFPYNDWLVRFGKVHALVIFFVREACKDCCGAAGIAQSGHVFDCTRTCIGRCVYAWYNETREIFYFNSTIPNPLLHSCIFNVLNPALKSGTTADVQAFSNLPTEPRTWHFAWPTHDSSSSLSPDIERQDDHKHTTLGHDKMSLVLESHFNKLTSLCEL
jgi:hypothetical protein